MRFFLTIFLYLCFVPLGCPASEQRDQSDTHPAQSLIAYTEEDGAILILSILSLKRRHEDTVHKIRAEIATLREDIRDCSKIVVEKFSVPEMTKPIKKRKIKIAVDEIDS